MRTGLCRLKNMASFALGHVAKREFLANERRREKNEKYSCSRRWRVGKMKWLQKMPARPRRKTHCCRVSAGFSTRFLIFLVGESHQVYFPAYLPPVMSFTRLHGTELQVAPWNISGCFFLFFFRTACFVLTSPDDPLERNSSVDFVVFTSWQWKHRRICHTRIKCEISRVQK